MIYDNLDGNFPNSVEDDLVFEESDNNRSNNNTKSNSNDK